MQGGWAITHFQFALGHDTGNCIVTQGWGGWPGRATRTQYGWAGASAGGLGYCPFSVCTGSRYRELYRDTGLGRLAWARDKDAIWPGWRECRGVGLLPIFSLHWVTIQGIVS